jgi:hypothetical protein
VIVVAQTLVIVALIGALGFGFWMHLRAMADAGEERERLLAEATKERASLLDRIQHPSVRQVDALQPVVHEPPPDPAEMAWIGREVPDYVQVGTPDGEPVPPAGAFTSEVAKAFAFGNSE